MAERQSTKHVERMESRRAMAERQSKKQTWKVDENWDRTRQSIKTCPCVSPDPQRCTRCTDTFDSHLDFLTHTCRPAALYQCSVCGHLYVNDDEFQSHACTCRRKETNKRTADAECNEQRTDGDEDNECHQAEGELSQSAKKKKRPRRPCIFCGKFATRLTDHIRGMHKNEPSVKAAMALPKKEQMERFVQFKKDGIFKANSHILAKKTPDYSKLLQERRQKILQDPQKDVVCCTLCKGFYSRALIYKHKRRCSASADNVVQPASFSLKSMSLDANISDKYTQEVLRNLENNEIDNLIRDDDWIKRFGFRVYKAFPDSTQSEEKSRAVLSKLRQLSALFIKFKKALAAKTPSSKVTSCGQMFVRDHILYVHSAVTELAGDPEGDLRRDELCSLVKDVCTKMAADCLLNMEDEEADEISKFRVVFSDLPPSYISWVQAQKVQEVSQLLLSASVTKVRKSSQSLPRSSSTKNIGKSWKALPGSSATSIQKSSKAPSPSATTVQKLSKSFPGSSATNNQKSTQSLMGRPVTNIQRSSQSQSLERSPDYAGSSATNVQKSSKVLPGSSATSIQNSSGSSTTNTQKSASKALPGPSATNKAVLYPTEITRADMKKNLAKFNKAEREMSIYQRATLLMALDDSLAHGGCPIKRTQNGLYYAEKPATDTTETEQRNKELQVQDGSSNDEAQEVQGQPNTANGQSPDSRTTADDQSTDGHSTADGQSTDGHSTADGQSTDGHSTADGQSTDGHSTADGQSTDGHSTADGQSTDGHSTADGQSTDGHSTADGQSTDGHSTADGQCTDGHSTADGQFTDGHSTADGQFTDGHSTADGQFTDSRTTADDQSTDGQSPCQLEKNKQVESYTDYRGKRTVRRMRARENSNTERQRKTPQTLRIARTSDQSHTTQTSGQQLQTTQTSGQQLPTTQTSGQQLQTTQTSGQQLQTTPTSGQQLQTTPTSGQQLQTTQTSGQQLQTTQTSGQQLQKTQTSGQQLQTTPTSGQQLQTTQTSGQQLQTTQTSGQQLQTTQTSGQQLQKTQTSGQQLQTTQTSGQQLKKTQTSGQQLQTTQTSGQQLQTTPTSGQQLQTTQTSGQQLQTTQTSGQQLQKTQTSGQQLQTTQTSGQQLQTTQTSGQQLQKTQTSGQQLQTTQTSGQQLQTTQTSGQQLQTTPTSGQQLQTTPTRGQQLQTTPTRGQQMTSGDKINRGPTVPVRNSSEILSLPAQESGPLSPPKQQKNVCSVKVTHGKETSSKDGQTKVSQTKDSQTKDSQTKDSQTKDSQTKVSQTKVSQTKVSQTKDSQTKVSQTKDSQTKVSQTKDSQTKVSQTKDSQTKVSQTKDSQTKVSQTKDSQTKVSQTKDSQTKVSQTKVILMKSPDRGLIEAPRHEEQISGRVETPSHNEQISGSVETPRRNKQISRSVETPSHDEQISGSAETPSHDEQISGSVGIPKHDEQISGSAETPSHDEQISGSVGIPRHDEQISGSAETPSHDEQISGSVGIPRHDKQISGSVGIPRHDDQISGSVETPSHDEQISGSVETPSHDEQISGSVETPSHDEQISGSVEKTPSHDEQISGSAETPRRDKQISGSVETPSHNEQILENGARSMETTSLDTSVGDGNSPVIPEVVPHSVTQVDEEDFKCVEISLEQEADAGSNTSGCTSDPTSSHSHGGNRNELYREEGEDIAFVKSEPVDFSFVTDLLYIDNAEAPLSASPRKLRRGDGGSRLARDESGIEAGKKSKLWQYSCRSCGKTFRHAGTLKVHKRLHSAETDEPNFQLRDHRRSSHTDEKTTQNKDGTSTSTATGPARKLSTPSQNASPLSAQSGRKRKLMIDTPTKLSTDELQQQLFNTSDIITNSEFAPPTKKLMNAKERGIIGNLLARPGRNIAKNASKLFSRNVVTQQQVTESDPDQLELDLDKPESDHQNMDQEVTVLPDDGKGESFVTVKRSSRRSTPRILTPGTANRSSRWSTPRNQTPGTANRSSIQSVSRNLTPGSGKRSRRSTPTAPAQGRRQGSVTSMYSLRSGL